MRYGKAKYLSAISQLKLGMKQLEPDGKCCSICGDSGHQAWECHHNPLEGLRHYHAFRCFICGQVFFDEESAREHFGEDPHETTKCKKPDKKIICCLGKDHPCMLNVNDGYCRAVTCQYQVQENNENN